MGTVKTATRGFPQEQIRRVLNTMSRGYHCAFYCEELKIHAGGWHDWHYKTYVATCFTTSDGNPAQKKRQRSDGTSYRIDVPRPEVVAELQEAAQGIDGHNQIRQGYLHLKKFWMVNKLEK